MKIWPANSLIIKWIQMGITSDDVISGNMAKDNGKWRNQRPHLMNFNIGHFWYYWLQEIKKYCCGLGSYGIIFIPNFVTIHSSYYVTSSVDRCDRQAWRQKKYVPQKCWYLPTSLYSITTQNTIINIKAEVC